MEALVTLTSWSVGTCWQAPALAPDQAFGLELRSFVGVAEGLADLEVVLRERLRVGAGVLVGSSSRDIEQRATLAVKGAQCPGAVATIP